MKNKKFPLGIDNMRMNGQNREKKIARNGKKNEIKCRVWIF